MQWPKKTKRKTTFWVQFSIYLFYFLSAACKKYHLNLNFVSCKRTLLPLLTGFEGPHLISTSKLWQQIQKECAVRGIRIVCGSTESLVSWIYFPISMRVKTSHYEWTKVLVTAKWEIIVQKFIFPPSPSLSLYDSFSFTCYVSFSFAVSGLIQICTNLNLLRMAEIAFEIHFMWAWSLNISFEATTFTAECCNKNPEVIIIFFLHIF